MSGLRVFWRVCGMQTEKRLEKRAQPGVGMARSSKEHDNSMTRSGAHSLPWQDFERLASIRQLRATRREIRTQISVSFLRSWCDGFCSEGDIST